MRKSALGRLLSPFGITQLIVLAAVGTALWLSYDPWRWGKVHDALRDAHPDADHIDGERLFQWISDPGHQQPLLLDVRTGAEFATSHLPGAKHVNAGEISAALGADVKADSPIVIYCAVGLESASVADSLKRREFKRVQYLEGGIFQWANDGRPLVGPDGATTRVDPGKSPHAGLLKSSHRTR